MARLVSCPPLCPLYCGKSRPCVIHACVCGIPTSSLRVYGNVYGLAALCCRVCPKCFPLSPILGQSTSACWLCLLAVPDVVCASCPPRMSLAASRWLSVERAVRVVYAVVFAPPTHPLTPPSPHNPHYITSVLVGFPPTVAHTTRVLPRRVDLWNTVHVSLSFTRKVEVGSFPPHPPCVLSSLVGVSQRFLLHRAPIHLSPPVVMHVYVLS